MPIRKITSLTLLLSFVLLILTSLVLYIVPEGRVAYWSDWRWLGLSKTQWGNLHINLGWLFLAAGLLHLGYNWAAVSSYMKNQAKAQRIFTPACTAALLVNLVFIIGTLLYLPPFSTILAFGHSFKAAAANKYGEPPYGHAELSSLRLFAQRTGLTPAAIKAGLTQAGIRFTGEDQTILAIAQANKITPKAVYDAMQVEDRNQPKPVQPFPAAPFPGMGQMKLKDLCRQYGLDQQRIIEALAASDIKAAPEQSLREIAAAHGSTPPILFAIIHAAANQP